MTEEEAIAIMAMIAIDYPNRKWVEEEVERWKELLSTVPFSLAKQNLDRHTLTSDYPPKISEIARNAELPYEDPEVYYRNKQIAHQEWVASGGDPEAFVYDPRSSNPRLTG